MSSRKQPKFVAVAMVFMALSGAATPVLAQETYSKWISFFEGDWAWSSDNGMVGEIKFERTDKEVPALHSRFKITKPSQASSVAIKGWDNESNMIVETGYNSAGASHQTKYKIVSDKILEGSWVNTEADGSVKKTKFKLRRVNDDMYVLEDPKFIEKGDDEPWKTITVKRKK